MPEWLAAILAVSVLTGCGLIARYIQPRVIAWETRKRAERKRRRAGDPS